MMGERVGIEVSAAIAEAAGLANVDVVAAYPITPQTHIVEHLADLVASGELDAEYVPVESEHSAMSACLGASAVSARTFTATAGQGLELMHEVLYVASAMQLPMVMSVADRALSSPINVWGDHSDLMSVRDTGWIQIVAENGQQAVDNVICGFRIGEDRRVLLPVMVHVDGFYLTHVVEPIVMPSREEVAGFLPPYQHPMPLDPRNPVTMGGFGPPYIYTEIKKAQVVNMDRVPAVVSEVWAEFVEKFGREYHPVETYRTEDAEVLLLTMGSTSETARATIDHMRDAGRKVGHVSIRLWRPFPFEEFRETVRGVGLLVVVDRAVSFGGPGGPYASEVRNALYTEEKRPRVSGFVAGLGGRDITIAGFEAMVNRGIEAAASGREIEFEMYGVRE